jgi:hypothetical protein
MEENTIRRGSFNGLGKSPRELEEERVKRETERRILQEYRRPYFQLSNELKQMLAKLRD